jgi:hypothetical protein
MKSGRPIDSGEFTGNLPPVFKNNGEPSRARTCDPLIKSQLLYQLSLADHNSLTKGEVVVKEAFLVIIRPMILIDRPDTPSRRMELIAEPRKDRGDFDPFEVGSWIELSDPLAITLNKEPVGDDKELAQFLSANNGQFRYDYVRLGCTFAPQAPERFEKAWLTVSLKAPDGDSSLPPISWSIFPLDNYDEMEESTSAKIGASVQIFSAEVGGDKKVTKKLYNLRGYREGKPNPYWEMISTATASLDGILRFHMVVRSPAGTATVGEVRLQAVISNRAFVAFRQKRQFDQSPSQEFHLPPA